MSNDTLVINITAVAPTGDTFARVDSGSSACAKCTTTGNINISNCDKPVDISWTFTTDDTFRENNPVTFTGQNNGKNFGTVSLSDDKKTAAVTDENVSGEAPHNVFNYTIHEDHSADDPSITNRR